MQLDEKDLEIIKAVGSLRKAKLSQLFALPMAKQTLHEHVSRLVNEGILVEERPGGFPPTRWLSLSKEGFRVYESLRRRESTDGAENLLEKEALLEIKDNIRRLEGMLIDLIQKNEALKSIEISEERAKEIKKKLKTYMPVLLTKSPLERLARGYSIMFLRRPIPGPGERERDIIRKLADEIINGLTIASFPAGLNEKEREEVLKASFALLKKVIGVRSLREKIASERRFVALIIIDLKDSSIDKDLVRQALYWAFTY